MTIEENMGEITTLTSATTRSRSIRATVPMGVVKQLNLKTGNKLSWKLEVMNDEIVIVVRPIKKNKGKN